MTAGTIGYVPSLCLKYARSFLCAEQCGHVWAIPAVLVVSSGPATIYFLLKQSFTLAEGFTGRALFQIYPRWHRSSKEAILFNLIGRNNFIFEIGMVGAIAIVGVKRRVPEKTTFV